ncbi:hypothetical protein PsorP6_010472 [Peronosclerospora sorghi]|uniref:Uncharacterized protein n=1 Tax=Peronosclerospora sorghi TaxID=230839 RepID=A0ACC0VU80_9STRA|nr:hypothetical protein PsorP6_010472 [Peronosclerospora sorghi]
MEEDVTIDVDGDLVIEEKETPADSAEAIEKMLSKMSARCLKEVRDSAMDYSKMSDRCREEVARRIRRYLARLDKGGKVETEKKERKTQDTRKKQTSK